MRTVKEMVAGGQKVRFSHYQNGELWYRTECGFEFPVPVVREPDESDIKEPEMLESVLALGLKRDAGIGTAVFAAEDKAMLFMRYIRKQVEFLKCACFGISEAGLFTK